MSVARLPVLVLFAIAAASCSSGEVASVDTSATLPIVQHVYTLAIHQDSSEEYTPCTMNAWYCYVWLPEKADFVGTLEQRRDSTFIVFGGNAFPPISSAGMHLDSSAVRFPFYEQDVYLTFQITTTPNGLRGVWVEQVDGHGQLLMGTISGTEQ